MMWTAAARRHTTGLNALVQARAAALSSTAKSSAKAKAAAVSRVRGTRDLLADDAEQHQHVLTLLQQTTRSYGFRPMQTPLLEYTDLFSRSLGDGSDIVMKEMYTFEDNSGKSVTLRPEGTAGVVRALLSNNMMFALPQKVTYAGSMFRYERPQRGRYREFQQFGVEFVGSSGPSVDVEVIAMASDALQALGIRDKATLELNSLGDAESRGRYREALQEYFSQYTSELSADSITRLERGSVLRILDSKSVEDQSVVANAPRLESFLSTEASERFDAVLRGLDALGISYRRNARLVRGLDYYSHTVFEFVENRTSPDSRNDDDDGDANAVQAAAGSGGIAVLAGGCYDNLSEMLGGPPVSCIGWAAGVDRLHLLRESAVTTSSTIAVVPVLVGDAPDAVLHESMRVAHSLRQRGLAVHFCHGRGNLKKQMKAAEKLGCDHAVILGSDEVAHKFVKVKNLARRQEQQVAAADLDAFDFV